MTDREMLEFAAKAAGYTLTWGEKYLLGDDEVDCSDIPYIKSNETDVSDAYWNPLIDDGDALRLLVQRRFWIKDFAPHDEPQIVQVPPNATPMGMIEIWVEDDDDPIHVEWYKAGADRGAATRLAITRAAAEIGRNRP